MVCSFAWFEGWIFEDFVYHVHEAVFPFLFSSKNRCLLIFVELKFHSSGHVRFEWNFLFFWSRELTLNRLSCKTFLIATNSPVSHNLAWKTTPKLPLPITRVSVYETSCTRSEPWPGVATTVVTFEPSLPAKREQNKLVSSNHIPPKQLQVLFPVNFIFRSRPMSTHFSTVPWKISY